MRRLLPIAAALALVTPIAALADRPPGISAPVTCSPSGRICVVRDADGMAAVRRGRDARSPVLWRARVGAGPLQPAEDGRSLVEVRAGSNLIPATAAPDTVVLTFHRPAQAPVAVALRDVVRDPAALPRTVSHRSWARSYGYDARGRYVLLTAEDRRLVFDPRSGRLLPG